MTIHIHTAFLKSDTRTLSASCKHHESSTFPYHQSYRKFHNITYIYIYATSIIYTLPYYYFITKLMQGIKTCMGTSAKVHTLESLTSTMCSSWSKAIIAITRDSTPSPPREMLVPHPQPTKLRSRDEYMISNFLNGFEGRRLGYVHISLIKLFKQSHSRYT